LYLLLASSGFSGDFGITLVDILSGSIDFIKLFKYFDIKCCLESDKFNAEFYNASNLYFLDNFAHIPLLVIKVVSLLLVIPFYKYEAVYNVLINGEHINNISQPSYPFDLIYGATIFFPTS
jgi:hypothetical protein